MAPDSNSDVIQLKKPPTEIGVGEFFSGQDVFITGGLGFMGKVLIEKLLWSCEDVRNVYFLVRANKRQSVNERVEKLLELPIFDRIKKDKPSNIKKLIPIEGDVLEPNLGISESNRKLLEDNVTTVFHVASSVHFNNPLKKSVLINIRGTKYVVDIVKRMKKLKVLVYVSTTFCNVANERIQEKLYPAKDDWRDLISMAETLDESALNAFTVKILDEHPNTYTYTKFLAEHLINEYSKELPCVIFRPSIVTFSTSEPKPGWVDNFNGPVGLAIGIITGILHVVYMDPDLPKDSMPCDYVINGLLVSVWYKGTSNLQECLIVNGASGGKNMITFEFMHRTTLKLVEKNPVHQLIWYPFFFATKNKYMFNFLFLFTHILPGILMDPILKRSNFKLKLIPMYRKFYSASEIITVFTLRRWEFDSKIFDSLRHFLSPEDEKTFFYDSTYMNNEERLSIGIVGMKKYMLGEKFTEEASAAAKKQYYRMYWLHQITRVFLSILLLGVVRLIIKWFMKL